MNQVPKSKNLLYESISRYSCLSGNNNDWRNNDNPGTD